jgi:hypothetical protein
LTDSFVLKLMNLKIKFGKKSINKIESHFNKQWIHSRSCFEILYSFLN